MAPPPPSTAIFMASATSFWSSRAGANRPEGVARSPSAAHVEDCAGDVGRFVVEEPEDRRGDFLGVPRPPERRHGAELVRPLRLAVGRMDLGENHARPYTGDANAVRTDFLRQADG